jgi:hypothetical protein
LVYADDVNILGGSVCTVKENTESLLLASKGNELEVNADKSKYMVMSCDQNAGRSQNIKTENTSFEMVEELKYLGTILTDQNSIEEEIKSRLKSGNACYNLVQNILLSSLLSKYTKIEIYRTITLPVVLYGCETWSLTFREGFRVKVCENRVLTRIFGPEGDKETGEGMRIHNELNVLYCLIFSTA